jgi:RNA polymerase sigma-70 factor (ECF subfamily)
LDRGPLNKKAEKALLVRVAQGDQPAFTQIVKHYTRVIYPYMLYWLKHIHVIDELVQDVFLRVWKNRQKLPQMDNFGGYVYVITRNLVNAKLKEQMMMSEEQVLDAFDELLNKPHLALELKELSSTIQTAIDSMPPRRKEVFRLSRQEGLTYEEIANELQISKGTVKEHMISALVYLRSYIREHTDIVLSLLAWLIPFLC